MAAREVHFYEGMFMRPHHLQAVHRHAAQLLHTSSTWDQHYNWGLRAIDIEPDALANHRVVVRMLRARLRGSRPPQPFRYRHQGSLATIGRKSAVADFGRVKLTGALAWWLWGAVHILFLAGRRNQFSVILGWVWSYFTFDVGVRLITGDGPSRAAAEPPE